VRQQIRRTIGAEYACIKCSMLLDVEPGPAAAPSAYCVRCGSCGTEQCCSCGVEWGPAHAKITCAEFQRRQSGAEDAAKGADPETARMLQQAVACPGKCGHTATKPRGDASCNVMSCDRCRLYFCYLCGEKLASNKYDPKDR
jgi:hypothetical protein